MAKKKVPMEENVLQKEAETEFEMEELDTSVSREEMALLTGEDIREDEVMDGNGHVVLSVKGREKVETEVAQKNEPEPALTSAPRQSARERQRAQEEHKTAVKLRQEEAVIIGKYVTANKQNSVLSGVIAGVESRGEHVFWVIYDGPVKVLIPFHEALPFLSDELLNDAPDVQVRQKQLLSKSIEAEVPFTVEAMEYDDEAYFAFGSRQKALERIRNRYFGKHAPNPLKIGDTVNATFFSVGAHAAWVNANGVDIRLTAGQISHRYIEDLQTVYRPGQQIDLCVQPERGEKLAVGDMVPVKDGRPQMRLSGLPTELQACSARLNQVREGSRFIATVTTHRIQRVLNPETKKAEARYVATLWLEGIRLPAFASEVVDKFQVPHSGAKVTVDVRGVRKSGYVFCKIIKVLSR